MTTDGEPDELHAFAAKIGMRREWFQDHKLMPHYDLTPERRARAIRAGAVEALAAYRASGVLGLYAPSGSVAGLFRGYASGNSGRDTKAARRRCETWQRIARREGMTGARSEPVSCWAAPIVN